MKEGAPKQEERFQIECVHCHHRVEVAVMHFGNGYVATCPDCKEIAYNSTVKPSIDSAK